MANWIFRLGIMLFHLTDSLCDYSQENKEAVIICVSNLLLGYCESKLLLSLSRKVIEHFSPIVTDIKARKALNYLSRTSYTTRAYNDITYHIDVVLKKKDDSKNNELDYFFFQDSSSIQKTVLLCEDLTDCNFYMSLTKSKYGNYYICADKQTGGGSGMKKKIEDLKQTNAVVLVIADSDKMYPEKKEFGNTAKSCISAYDNSRPNIYLYVTDTHEAENLIPLEFVVTHCSKKYSGLNFIKKLKQKDALSVLQYYDYKEGITYESIKDNQDYYNFAKDIYTKIYGDGFEKHVIDTSIKANDKQHIFPPIKSNILELYVTFLKDVKQNKLDYNYASIDANNIYRDKLCKLILAFTCARNSEPMH